MKFQRITLLISIFFTTLFTLFCSTTIHLKGEIHNPKTSDNWNLTLEHFKPRPNTTLKKYPVIICHGLIGNRNYFRIKEDESLVFRLISQGFDVWLLDLRGRPDAGSPSLFWGEKTYNYSFDDYATKDLDAAIGYVLEKTKSPKVNWIGHSMGGMVVYTKVGTYKEDRIANLVTIGSPFSFYNPTKNLKILNNLSGILPFVPVIPSASISHLESDYKIPLPKKPFLKLFYYSENTESEMEVKLKGLSTSNESPNVFKQFGKAIETGDVYSLDGKTSYTANLKNFTVPVLLIAGRRDHLGTPMIVRQVYDSISSSDKTMLVAGRSEGFSEDYGHVDLVMGINSDKDINIPIANWLNERN